MDWWKWALGIAGTLVVGIITNAMWDGIKAGNRWVREWSRDRATRAALNDAQRAARLAGQTQRLVAWSATIVFSSLLMFCLVAATLLFSVYVEPGLQRIILHASAAALIIMLAVFLRSAIRILDQVLDHIRQQDSQDPPTSPPAPLPQAPAQPADQVPAPTPEEQRR